MNARVGGPKRELLAAAGHLVILAGFALPWATGEFGARSEFSGVALVRLAEGIMETGLADGTFAMPLARLVLILVPLAAANALLLLILARLRALNRDTARRCAVALAVPVGVTALSALTLLVIAARGSMVLDGPALGLYVTIAGAAMAAVSGLRPLRDTAASDDRARPQVEQVVQAEA